MPTIVELPDSTELEFPDGMDEIAMRREIVKAFPQFAQETPSEAAAISAPGQSPAASASRNAPLIPEAFPAQAQQMAEAKAANVPELSGAEVEQMLMTPQVTIPNPVPKSWPISRGLFKAAKTIPEFVTAPAAPEIMMAQRIPFVREALDAAMGAGMVKSAAQLAGEAYATGNKEQMAEALASGAMGATMLAGPHVAPVLANEVAARRVGAPDIAGVDVATEALRNRAIKRNRAEAEIAANERPVTLERDPRTGVLIPKARELNQDEAERLFLQPATETANQEIQNAAQERQVQVGIPVESAGVNARGIPAETSVSDQLQRTAPGQAQEAEVIKPAPVVPEQAPETQAPTAATVSEGKPPGVAAPGEQQAISQPTPEGESGQVGVAPKRATEVAVGEKPAKRGPVQRPWDIIDEIEASVGKIRRKSAAKPGSEGYYTPEFVELQKSGASRKLFSDTGQSPDEAVETLRRSGFLGADATVDDLRLVLEQANNQRRAIFKGQTPEIQADKFQAALQKQGAKKGSHLISVGDLSIGDKFKIGGEELEVVSINPDTGEVTVKDGRKFGHQTIPDGADIAVEKGSLETKPQVPVFAKEEFALNAPETIEQQKARLAREEALAKEKADQEALQERAAKPLVGSTGDIGQGDLLGGGDLFSEPKPPVRGPGAAPYGGVSNYTPISELTDKLKTSPAKTPTSALRFAEKTADAWAEGKSLVTRAIGKLLSVPAALKQQYVYTRRFDDVTREIAKLDRIIQVSAGKSRDAGKAMRESVKNVPMREGMAFYMEGATDAQIRATLANLPAGTKPYVRRALEAALKLPQDVRDNATDMAQYFAARGDEGVNEGVLEGLLEDYYTHVWKDTRNMPSKLADALSQGRVNEYFQYSRERKIPTLLEGIAQGKEPVLDPASVIPRYNYLLDRAIASRKLMKSLEDLKVTDTDPATGNTRSRPLLAPVGTRRTIYDQNQVPQARLIKIHIAGEAASDYRAIDHPSLRKWIWAATDEQGVPVFYEGDLRVHPAYYERLARMMDRSRLTARPAMRRALAVSTEVKGFKLGVVSFFHPIQVGTHALFHHISPLVHGEIDWDSPKVHFAIEKGGLMIGPDNRAITSFAEGILTRGLVNKIPIIGPWSHALAEWTFADYIPRLKLATFEHFYRRAKKAYPNLTDEEAAARAGSSANYAYGELNQLWLGKEGRDPGTQRWLRLAFLAPDFGESRLSFVLKAATKYGGEERLGLITAVASLYIASRIGNIMTHGDPEVHDSKHLFDVKVGDRWVGVRSIVGDIAHLLTKARQFWEVRLNPLYSRTLLAALSGRDVTGHVLTPGRFAADVAKQVVPIHLSGLTRDDRQVWESMLAAIGLQTWRAGATTEIHRLAQDWRKSRNIKDDTEVLASPDSPYRKARLALEFGNRQDFRSAIQDLYKQRRALGDPTPRETVKRNFDRYYHLPFAGNQRLEMPFKRSLSIQEKSVYQDAQKEREKLWRQFNAWF